MGQTATAEDGGSADARQDCERVESPDYVEERQGPASHALPPQPSPVGSRTGRLILKLDSSRSQSINVAWKANALLIPTVLMALETKSGRGEMEWVGLIIQWVAIALECVVYATLGGGAESTNGVRSGRSNRSDGDSPRDAVALARYNLRSSTHEVGADRSFLSSSESPHPLWDRELDG